MRKYKVVRAKERSYDTDALLDKLSEKVTRELNMGWELQGSPFIDSALHVITAYQAMYKA